jgi:hypothetical protein
MDKEEARFILRCFRPDGADAENPDFAEALAWAAKDRELGDWLAHERASDADFATALNAVTIPSSLREEILAGLAVERGDAATYPDSFDRSVMGAMASIRPPENLRAEILAAMDRTAAGEQKPPSRRLGWRFAVPFAAAAGIGFAFLVSGPGPAGSKAVVNLPKPEPLPPERPIDTSIGGAIPISIGKVEKGFIDTIESPTFTLDLRNPDHHALFEHLKSAKLPCPNACLPKGLKEIPGLGCRELKIDGKRGALVCFKQENDVVHLVAFKRCDVRCKLPKKGEPDISRHGKWSVARWADEDWVFVLMGEKNVDTKRLADLF